MMMTAIGLMSGTSLDGVDVALIETDGKRVERFGPSGYRPYTDKERGLLRQALTEAIDLPQRDARPGILREAERTVTIAHAEAVASFIAQNRITCEDIDIVGFHGQTVLHRPAQKMTVQIGDATALAKAIHIPVMHDFRAADVAAGGQGAPFVPVYHRALAQSLEREGPMVVVNIGGVSNITYIDGADTLIACDTGPGNALLDDYMFRKMSQPFDCEGRLAAQGTAGCDARQPALLPFELTVHQNVLHSLCNLIGSCIGCGIDNGCRIEDGHVRIEAAFQQSAVIQMFTLRR